MQEPKLSTMVVLYNLNLKINTSLILENLPLDDNIIKIENIPNLLKEHNKKVFIFKDYNGKSGGYAYESKFFAGDVNYFIDPISGCGDCLYPPHR